MSIYDDPFPDLLHGATTMPVEGGHQFSVTPTDERAFHTGRRRFRVYCTTCRSEIHEATTGPHEAMKRHATFMRSAN